MVRLDQPDSVGPRPSQLTASPPLLVFLACSHDWNRLHRCPSIPTVPGGICRCDDAPRYPLGPTIASSRPRFVLLPKPRVSLGTSTEHARGAKVPWGVFVPPRWSMVLMFAGAKRHPCPRAWWCLGRMGTASPWHGGSSRATGEFYSSSPSLGTPPLATGTIFPPLPRLPWPHLSFRFCTILLFQCLWQNPVIILFLRSFHSSFL
jgi:hypothetical protein